MLSVTQTSAPRRATRASWRDAIKEDQRLGRDAVLIGLLMADYLKDDDPEPLWAVVDVLLRQSRMSRAALYRAQAELRECGFLWRVESAKPGRAPRWLPTIPTIVPAPRKPEDSHTENRLSQTENRSSHTETRNHTQTRSTPDVGPEGQDYESQRILRMTPTTAAEKADRRKLGKYVTNLPPEVVDTLWGWMRTGKSLSGRDNSEVDRPGATAAKMEKKPTDVPGVTEWHGWFRRHYMTEQQRETSFRVVTENDRVRDPWATSA